MPAPVERVRNPCRKLKLAVLQLLKSPAATARFLSPRPFRNSTNELLRALAFDSRNGFFFSGCPSPETTVLGC